MEIKVNQSDLRKVNRLFNGLNKATVSELNRIVDNNGLKIVREIKKPPIPVDTGNLRNNVVYDALKKQILDTLCKPSILVSYLILTSLMISYSLLGHTSNFTTKKLNISTLFSKWLSENASRLLTLSRCYR